MSCGHASRQWLEAFKFTIYLTTPIAATIFLGTGAYPYLEKIIHNVRIEFSRLRSLLNDSSFLFF